MLEILTAALTKARRRVALALAVGALVILPVLLCGCKGQRQTASSDNAGQQLTASDDAAAIEAIERIAGELPMFEPRQFLYYGRIESWDCQEEEIKAQYTRGMTELLSLDVSIDALVDLLRHDDPKMRTLAIALLIDKGAPSALPHIAELLDDDAPTYRKAEEWREAVRRPYIPTVWVEQTVGEVAAVALRASQGEAPRPSVRSDRDSERGGFEAYWDVHKDLPYCASWFALRLQRASRATSPTQDEYVAGIRRVRRQIDAIPPDDRAWTLLRLYGEAGSDALVSEAELVELCKELGPEKLLSMLRNKIPSDDPDLQPREMNNWVYQRMSMFVLYRAEQFFEPSDAQALLACEQWHGSETADRVGAGFITPWWAIAAARLQPENAAQILRPSFQHRYGVFDRAELAVTLWELAGESQLAFLTDWFYNERPEASTKGARARYLERISAEDTPLARRTIAIIVRDSRFDRLDWEALVTILTRVNGWVEEPVVPTSEIRDLKHPMGLSMGRYLFDAYPEKALREYPEETANVRRALADWRERLRVSVPQWAPSAGE